MKEMKTLNGYEIVDDAVRKKVTELQNTILEKMCPTTTDIGDPLVIEPVPGTSFSDLWSTTDAPAQNVVGDWQNPDNWRVETPEEGCYSYYLFPASEGSCTINYTVVGAMDCPEISLWEAEPDGQPWEHRCDLYANEDGTYSESFDFANSAGSGLALIKVFSPCYAEGYAYFQNLEIWNKPRPQEGVLEGLTLTISNGTETKTYEYSGDCPYEAMAYNWMTGQTINIGGDTYEDIGVPIEIAPLPGINTLQSSCGFTKVTYKGYPAKVIEKLQKEITALKGN